jgi:hypothetical protein
VACLPSPCRPTLWRGPPVGRPRVPCLGSRLRAPQPATNGRYRLPIGTGSPSSSCHAALGPSSFPPHVPRRTPPPLLFQCAAVPATPAPLFSLPSCCRPKPILTPTPWCLWEPLRPLVTDGWLPPPSTERRRLPSPLPPHREPAALMCPVARFHTQCAPRSPPAPKMPPPRRYANRAATGGHATAHARGAVPTSWPRTRRTAGMGRLGQIWPLGRASRPRPAQALFLGFLHFPIFFFQ